MTYKEARVYLDKVSKYGSVLGLDTIRELLHELGDPQKDLKFIHIAGTNGKGSVLAYTSTILSEAGYKVGKYVSPTVISYLERIQVNGQWISEDAFARLTKKIQEALDFAEDDVITIYIDPSDEALLPALTKHFGFTPVLSKESWMGGMRAVIRSKNILIDNSFATLLHDAKEEFIFTGGGTIISNASPELTELAHRIDAPVCDSLMGKGGFSGEDPLYTGMLGMHGTKASNLGVSKCDLLIVLGARFSDRVTGNTKTFAKQAKILQIDVDAAEINKNIVVDASVIGDEKEVLKQILEKLPQMKHSEWTGKISELKEKYPLRYDHSQLTGPYIIEKLYELTKGDAIITTEVGQNQMWAAQYFKYKEPRTFLSSGGLGTMGYGLGAAIGAKMGRPDKTVVNIAGDGCFRMNMNEIATAVRCGRPLIEIVLNNHVLGMVRQWQTLFYDHRYSHTILNDAVDFVKLAEAMGAKAIRITKMEEVEPALKEALACPGPIVLDCMIDQDLSVFPMVPAGASIDDIFDEEDMKNNEQSV